MTIELYHFGGAICAYKVRIVLAEKRLDWQSHVVTDLRDPEYLKLNPKGVVPTLVHDGHVLGESRLICEYIEDRFPEVPLMPLGAWERFCTRMWGKQIDDGLHLNIFVISFLTLGGWGMRQLPPEQRLERLPKDPVKQSICLDLLEHGVDSKWLPVAIDRFATLMTEMNRALTEHKWLASDCYTLADAEITAYLFRLSQLQLSLFWEKFPAVEDWLARVTSRESYEMGMANWITPEEAARYNYDSSEMQAIVGKRL